MKHIRNRICLLLLACMAYPAMAQVQIIKGVVLDEKSEAVIGATVSVPGTSIGTATNLEGQFTLDLPASQKTIQVAYLGYQTQTVNISGKTEVIINLVQSNTELDEVVVVGYGSMPKSSLVGAVGDLKAADIADLSASSLSATLQGMMSGVSVSQSSNRPGEPARVTIRGQSPELYVIDDVVSTQTAFNNLDPNMIESISVLKDASAAVYGARSAQGVVIVRTKQGHVGKPKISYQGQFGYNDEFYRSKMMDSYNFGLTWNAVRAADPTQAGFDPLRHLFQADELEAMKSLNYDYLDQYWSSGSTQKHSINVSGGNENATYFIGASYQTQDGNLSSIYYDRWNYHAGVNTKINKWTKASMSLTGDYGTSRKTLNRVGGTNAEKDYVMMLTRPRYIPEYVTDPSGNLLPIPIYGITNGQIEQTQSYHFGVIEDLGNFEENKPQNIRISSSLEYEFGWSEILKGLKLKATYSKSISNSKDNDFGSEYLLYRFPDGVIGRGGSGNHLYVDTPGYPVNFDNMSTIRAINGSSSYLRRSMSRSDSYQLNFYVTYARTFGLHDVNALFTIEKSESENESLWGNVTLPYSFTNYQSSGASGDQTTSFGRTESGILSYVGRMNYSYANKYLAEFLIRSDASTKFAPENYWGVFPSLLLGWIISEESWFRRNVSFMDFLKIRGSFGLSGRDNISAWAWLQTYSSNVNKGPIFGSNPDLVAGSHFSVPDAVPNRDSHWDKSYKSNLGFDTYFLRNRLSLTLEGYYEWYRDEFMAISSAPEYPTTVGANASASNWAATDRFGTELSLGWRDKIGKDFKYNIKLNTALSDNKLIKRAWPNESTRALDAIVPNERSDRGVWGYECIGMFRSYQEIAEYFAENNLITYLNKTQADVHPGMLIYRDVRGSQKSDGTYYEPGDPNDPQGNRIDSNDRIKLSNRSSNIYGFTLNFGAEYKSFSISAQLGASWGSYSFIDSHARRNSSAISTASGYDVMQYTNLPSFWTGNMFVYEDVLDAQGRVVAYQNLDAKYPNLRFSDVNANESSFWMINDANVFLRNLTMAYSLPKAWVNKIGIESCRLNLTGQNLLEFYNPYPDKFRSTNSPYSTYPLLRQFTLGLNVSF